MGVRMTRILKHRVRRSALMFLVCILAVNGCSSWVVLEGALNETGAGHVRTTLEDGDRVEIRKAHVQADTLLGIEAWSTPAKEVAIPLAKVHRVEERRIAVVRAIAAAGGAMTTQGSPPAQKAQAQEPGWRIKPSLAEGRKVRISLPGKREPLSLFGRTTIQEEGVYLGASGKMLGIGRGPASADTLWIDRASIRKMEMVYGEKAQTLRGALYGGIIGLFGGFVAAAIETESCKGEFLCGVSYLLFPPAGALGGTFIGAIVGTFVKTEKWMEVPRRDYDVAIALRPGGSGRVGVVVRF